MSTSCRPGLTYWIQPVQLVKPHVNQYFKPGPGICLEGITNKRQVGEEKLILYFMELIEWSDLVEIKA